MHAEVKINLYMIDVPKNASSSRGIFIVAERYSLQLLDSNSLVV